MDNYLLNLKEQPNAVEFKVLIDLVTDALTAFALKHEEFDIANVKCHLGRKLES